MFLIASVIFAVAVLALVQGFVTPVEATVIFVPILVLCLIIYLRRRRS